jgi:hypothetical protein
LTTLSADHFLKVFTPDDAVGRVGKKHEARIGP